MKYFELFILIGEWGYSTFIRLPWLRLKLRFWKLVYAAQLALGGPISDDEEKD